jgi:four helix bundle protein
MSYQKLQIWQLARGMTTEVHNMTLKLPKFEQFEEARQIRRSMKSVRSNIVEGYGRRFYKLDYIRFIIYALASNDETIDHLDILYETKSLTDEKLYKELRSKLEILGRKMNNFLQSVEREHTRPIARNKQEEGKGNETSDFNEPASSIQNPESSIQNQVSSNQNPESNE